MMLPKQKFYLSEYHTIRKRAVQTLLSWVLLNKYISPTAVITLVTFFRTVTIATLMYFRLQEIRQLEVSYSAKIHRITALIGKR